MYIEKVMNNGIAYLRLVESVYVANDPTLKGSRKRIICSLGPLKKFDDGKPDFVQRLKESFKNGNPIIKELIPYCSSTSPLEKYKFDLSEGDPDCIGHPKLYSHCLIECILEELGLVSFFGRYKQFTNYDFDLLGFFRLLIYGRILNPASKINTINQNNDYYNPIIDNPYEYNVYDTLSFIEQYQTSIINKINKSLITSFGRTTNIIYYDVTNFFYETERPDDDLEDEEGNIIKKGIRKFGVCKEERKLPIVQMGLFIDEQGIPISIETFPGNTLDHLTVIESLENTIDNLNLKRYIFVGDRGVYRGNNTAHLLNRNNGYIISKSIAKTNKKEKEWIFNDEDYVFINQDFKYKSRLIKRTVRINDNEKQDIVEKVIVYWSKKFYDKQIAENKSFLDFIDKLEQSPSSFRLSKFESKNIAKYIKKEVVNKNTGEIINSDELKAVIDYEKINEFKSTFGYYQIVSSEIKMDDKSIIDAYHGLSRIEDQFRTMKGSLDTRPLFVRTEGHIKAHLLTCMIALIAIRIIQNKIVEYKKVNSNLFPKKEYKKIKGQLIPITPSEPEWEMGLSGDRIQKALNKWTVETLTNQYYRFNNLDDQDLKLILDAFNIKIPTKLFTKMDLKQIKTSIKITT